MEQPRKTYKIVVNNDEKEPVEIDAELIPYIKTLANMIQDYGENNDGSSLPPIPLYGAYTAKDVAKMVKFYKTLQEIKSTEDSFNKHWFFESMKDSELSVLAKLANYLDANDFLSAIIDFLRYKLGKFSTDSLKNQVEKLMSQENPKRKATTQEMDNEEDSLWWRTTRIHYRREVYLQRILALLLGDDGAGPRIDRRIRQFVEPLVYDSGEMAIDLIVRNDQKKIEESSLFVNLGSSNVTQEFDHANSTLSWARGLPALYKARLNDIVVGDHFFAFINEAGVLSVFGEYGGGDNDQSATLEENPLGKGTSRTCIAIWALTGRLCVLTPDSLFLIQGVDNYLEINTGTHFDLSSIVDVIAYNGGHHMLFLTREGLFKWTAPTNYFNAGSDESQSEMSSGEEEEWLNYTGIDEEEYYASKAKREKARLPVIKKIQVNGLDVFLVARARYATIVVTKDGRLYVKGKGKTELGLGLPEGQTEKKKKLIDTEKEWRAVELGSNLWAEIDKVGGIRLITTSSDYEDGSTVIVAGNQIYWTNRKTGLFERLEDSLKGDVVSVKIYQSKNLLVATTQTLYLIGPSVTTGDVFKGLGGSDSTSTPFELLIPYNGEAYDPVLASPSYNKKARFGCVMCFAHALFIDEHKNAVCSTYCAHKITQ